MFLFGSFSESGQKLDIVEVTLNEDLQKNNLHIVLNKVNKLLNLDPRKDAVSWTLEGKHE